MGAWIVRGGSHYPDADTEQEFLTTGSVGIYFGVDRDMTDASRADLWAAVRQFYIRENWHQPGESNDSAMRGVFTRFANQLLTFRDDIQVGDTIIMPRKGTGGHTIARGTVTSDYRWCAEPYPHRRRVCWTEHEMPRESVEYQWASSDQRTVFRVDVGR